MYFRYSLLMGKRGGLLPTKTCMQRRVTGMDRHYSTAHKYIWVVNLSFQLTIGEDFLGVRVGVRSLTPLSTLFHSFHFNHLYSHKPYTTVQRRHKYTYNKYRKDINIYTVYTTKTCGVRQPREQNIYLYFA